MPIKGKLAIGAIVGAVAGVVAGVLTAPKSGKETRADLKLKADELKNEALKKKDFVVKKADDVKKQTEESVGGVFNSAKDKLHRK